MKILAVATAKTVLLGKNVVNVLLEDLISQLVKNVHAVVREV